jgi:hypothetical protein
MYQKMFTFFTIFYLVCVSETYAKPPNIVFILTDDQDTVLGGLVSVFVICKLLSKVSYLMLAVISMLKLVSEGY